MRVATCYRRQKMICSTSALRQRCHVDLLPSPALRIVISHPAQVRPQLLLAVLHRISTALLTSAIPGTGPVRLRCPHKDPTWAQPHPVHKPPGTPAAALQAQLQGWAPPGAPALAQMRQSPQPLSCPCPAAGGCYPAPQALRGCGQRGCSPGGCSPASRHTGGCLQHERGR